MSREEAIEILSDMRAEYNLFGDAEEATRYHVLSMAIHEMKAIQTERKVGKWIIHSEVKNIYGGTYIECSECGEKYVVQHIEYEKFCRNCGADMRGINNE